MKRLIRLTEGDIRRLVKKSVNRILRETYSDGPDWDEIYSGEMDDEMALDDNVDFGPAITANDFDDIDADSLDNYNNEDDYEGMDFEDMEDMPDDYLGMDESKKRMSRIIRESINKVLSRRRINEDSRRFETVPEDVARRYGFKPEYNMGNGTEVWGKYLNPGETSNMLLFKLGIQSWATQNAKGHVGIYVEPEHTKSEPGSWRNKGRRKIGDYVDTEWADKDGAIFHNPKNGHFKRFNVQDL